MRAGGYEPEDYAHEVVQIWPQNLRAFSFFARLDTQWRVGMSGPTGLDYTAVLALIRAQRLPRETADALFDDVQTMERAALQQMNKKPD
ncbi:MAG: DUF1799 domain-containing protein [Caldilineaceae bacterium]|nr:DUF1799 domain-containing protein [Caldilineaceae bacterium]